MNVPVRIIAARRSADPPRHGRGAGLTLVEIMFAMALTTLIGAGVSAMIVSVSYGTTTRSEQSRVNIKQKIVSARISAAIRSSKMVLAEGPEHLVLWTGDARKNSKPNLSEIRRIEWDSTAAELWSYRAPPGLADAQDTTYNLADDLNLITSTLAGSANFPGRPWATNVADWTVAFDDPDPRRAQFVEYSITFDDGGFTDAVSGAAAFRTQ